MKHFALERPPFLASILAKVAGSLRCQGLGDPSWKAQIWTVGQLVRVLCRERGGATGWKKTGSYCKLVKTMVWPWILQCGQFYRNYFLIKGRAKTNVKGFSLALTGFGKCFGKRHGSSLLAKGWKVSPLVVIGSLDWLLSTGSSQQKLSSFESDRQKFRPITV